VKGPKFEVNANGCHIWVRAKNNRGYGVEWYEGKLHLSHRVSWHKKYGTWPRAGMVTDHICEVKACVNVEHLRELTNSENIQRAYPFRDEEHARKRAINNAAHARYRARLKARIGGENNAVVQDR